MLLQFRVLEQVLQQIAADIPFFIARRGFANLAHVGDKLLDGLQHGHIPSGRFSNNKVYLKLGCGIRSSGAIP